jgi:hypothetical protein
MRSSYLDLMRRRVVVLWCLVAAAVVAAAAVALIGRGADPPLRYTPDGSATIWLPPVQVGSEGHTGVLVGARLTVGRGGRPGALRLRAIEDPFAERTRIVTGPKLELAGDPAVHRVTMPSMRWNPRVSGLAVDQTKGGLAILSACPPDSQGRETCRRPLRVFQPALGAGVNPMVRKATSEAPGVRLSVEPIVEPDIDGDGTADTSADRTDLRLEVKARKSSEPGVSVMRVTIHNEGPRPADIPVLSMRTPPGAQVLRFSENCTNVVTGAELPSGADPSQACRLPRLRPRARAVVEVRVSHAEPGALSATAIAEGPDLSAADNVETLRIG